MPLFGKKEVETELVKGTLVAAFHKSLPPLVWRFDLERNHSFAVTLEGEEGDCELGLTSQKGDFYPVARFAAREDALEALEAVHKILLKNKGSLVKKTLLGALAFVALILVIGAGGFYVFFHGSQLASHIPGAGSSGPSEIQEGMPLPADQVLRPPTP